MGKSRVLGALLLVGGCATDWWTSNITETRGLPSGAAIGTNADMRLVHRFTGYDPDTKWTPDAMGVPRPSRPPRDFLCAEPSPDVARAVQAAMSVSAGAAGTATPPAGGTAIEAQLAFQTNASRSESVAQLTKRIATIQLLRDGLYRACEAYANGAIGQEIYTAIVSRYDRMMITMLLAEMAVGNFGSAAILSGNSSADASADASAGAGGRATLATRNREEAQRQWEDQHKIVTAQNTRNEEAKTKLTANPTDPAVQEEAKVEKAKLDSATAILDERKIALETAKTDEANAKKDAATAAQFASARGRTSAASEGRIVDSPARAAKDTAEVLARMQRTYMNEPQGHSLLLMCFSEMASTQNIRQAMRDTCKDLFASATSPATQGLRWDATARQQLADLDNDRINALAAKLTPAQASALLAKLLQNQATPSGLPTRPRDWNTASPHAVPR